MMKHLPVSSSRASLSMRSLVTSFPLAPEKDKHESNRVIVTNTGIFKITGLNKVLLKCVHLILFDLHSI